MYHDVSATFRQAFSQRSTIVIGQDPPPLLDYERWSDVTLTSIDLLPTVSWYLPRLPIFISGGLDIAIPLKAVYNNNERIVSEGYVYLDGSNTTLLLGETEIPGAGRPRLDLHVAAGIDIYLSDHFYLTPQGGALLPLSAVSDADPSWKVTTEYAVLILKYRF
jgi:hypothetical protein